MDSRRIRTMTEVALTVALAAALNPIQLWQMPMGGSISLQMIPIIVLALRRGPAAGLLAGALYGGVDYLIEPYAVHWIQVLLDYPVAFALVGCAGFLSAPWRAANRRGDVRMQGVYVVAAALIGGAARFLASWVSGFVFFSEYAPAGQPAWIYSAAYNAFYIVPSALIAAVVAVLLLLALEKAVPSA